MMILKMRQGTRIFFDNEQEHNDVKNAIASFKFYREMGMLTIDKVMDGMGRSKHSIQVYPRWVPYGAMQQMEQMKQQAQNKVAQAWEQMARAAVASALQYTGGVV